MVWNEDADAVVFSEPILAKDNTLVRIDFVQPEKWEVKAKDKWSAEDAASMAEYIGRRYDAMSMNLTIIDQDVHTEHGDAQPKRGITHQFNLEKYPFPKGGVIQFMGRQGVYEIESALGFDPVFTVAGETVEPYITKAGNKVAPKVDGVKRVINPDFFNAYFHPDGTVNPTNWIGKELKADIKLEKSEVYGPKNVVARFKKPSVV